MAINLGLSKPFIAFFLTCSAFLSLVVSAHAQAVFRPPFTPPAPGSDQPVGPNVSNPNQKVRVPRPNAPGPHDLLADADKEEVEGSLRHLKGNVRLETTETMIQADEIDYDEDTGEAILRGHVRFEHFYNGDKVECDHAVYNLDDETGTFYDVRGTSPAKVQAHPGLLTTSNPFYFEGAWAERIHDKYILHSGFITDCKVPRPWWTLRGPKFDVVPDDRAIAYHATFRLRGIPMFYLPAFYKSLKKEPRKSGFLVPNVGHSSLWGYVFGGGYYWAINRSYDATYRALYLSERGLAHMADFRGKIRPGTDFNVALYAVNDFKGVVVGENNGQPVIQKQGGETVSFKGKSDLGDGWQARGEIDYLSSFLFRQSFSMSIQEAVSSESRSIGFLTKHWSTFDINIVADTDTQFQSVAPDDKITIRKLPEVEFGSREYNLANPLLPLWFSMSSSAGLFHRSEPDYSTGATVDRIDFSPRLTTAFPLFGIRFMPSFSIHETQYGAVLENGKPVSQDYLRSARDFSLTILPPSLERTFKAPKWLGEKMKHVIEPRLEYRNVTGIGPDYDKIVRFDATDLLSNTNELRISLANRLYVKDKDGNVKEVMSWELSQTRFFDPTFGGSVVPGQENIVASEADLDGFPFIDGPRNYSPIVSAFRFQPNRIGIEWRTDYDPARGEIVNSGFTTDVRFSQWFVSVGHFQIHSDPLLTPAASQFRGLIGYGNQNRKGWNAGLSYYYDFIRGITQFSTLQVTYNTDCCGITAEYRRFNIGARDDTQYRVAFAISNVGMFGNMKKQERIF